MYQNTSLIVLWDTEHSEPRVNITKPNISQRTLPTLWNWLIPLHCKTTTDDLFIYKNIKNLRWTQCGCTTGRLFAAQPRTPLTYQHQPRLSVVVLHIVLVQQYVPLLHIVVTEHHRAVDALKRLPQPPHLLPQVDVRHHLHELGRVRAPQLLLGRFKPPVRRLPQPTRVLVQRNLETPRGDWRGEGRGKVSFRVECEFTVRDMFFAFGGRPTGFRRSGVESRVIRVKVKGVRKVLRKMVGALNVKSGVGQLCWECMKDDTVGESFK